MSASPRVVPSLTLRVGSIGVGRPIVFSPDMGFCMVVVSLKVRWGVIPIHLNCSLIKASLRRLSFIWQCMPIITAAAEAFLDLFPLIVVVICLHFLRPPKERHEFPCPYSGKWSGELASISCMQDGHPLFNLMGFGFLVLDLDFSPVLRISLLFPDPTIYWFSPISHTVIFLRRLPPPAAQPNTTT